jgi:xylulokinase
LLDALDALAAQTPLTAVRLVGGGARSAAYRQVVAELCEFPVSLANADEAVATGACVQAAAVALDITHGEVAQRWGLGQATPLGAAAGDTAGVRARYAELRSATHPSTA